MKLKHWISSSDRHVFLTLIAVTILARLITFFRLTIDYDETTYAVMADHMLQGAVLYKDVIDIKQPGIFIIFGLIQLLFGKSVIVIRLMTALVVASSAYLLYLTKRKLEFDFWSSFVSALAFILMFNFYFGFAANTEVFFVSASCLGIYLFFRYSYWYTYLLCGLAFGIGYTIKQHVIFDFAALGMFFFGWSVYQQKLSANLSAMTLMVAGFLIPPAATHLIFWTTGYYEYYHFITYVAPFNYSSSRDWLESGIFLWKAVLLYLPFFLAALAGIRSSQWTKEVGGFVALLMMMALLAVIATGQEFQHYYLQLAFAVSFAAGEITHLAWVQNLLSKKYIASTLKLLVIFYAIALSIFYYNRYILRPNIAAELVHFLDGKLTKNMTLYTGDAPQYLYWHFDKLSPTPYIHASILTKPSNIYTLDIDLKKELDKIYTAQPDIIILSEGYPYEWFHDRVAENYALLGQVREYNIYQR